MIQQPELGRKIADVRKAKGLTQEELVEECNLSVRTLQRIEAGEVTPRPYTVKLIFEALDIHYDNSLKKGLTGKLPGQFYIRFIDLFNLKTNTMKKITILSIMLLCITFGLFVLTAESKAQKAENITSVIKELQNKLNRWITEEKVDSVMTLYREDAEVIPYYSGLAEVRESIQSALDGGYKMIDFTVLAVSAADSIAVEKYFHVFEYEGRRYKQKGLTEWRLTQGKWLIVNDIMINY